ncbi:GCN5-related N-acetyltransferase [Bacillus methanolicus PB1]|uniref:GCN5-related N-acetyltransferase n=1 Tax=Bacillus methanolicus PB1 TaxID=997296 RepID=I3E701_BACMT|nr:GNAT family N-acetyltransferase [Bacillus methanolicus]EIJ82272.1 GCN5-related N-acetyltransferase [Bacillus methanolicus PB1]
MTNHIQILDMLEEDKDLVRQLLIESYRQYEPDFQNQEVWSEYLGNIAESVDNPDVDRILVAKNGQDILGSLQLFDSSEKAYDRPELNIFSPIVRLLAVHPKARGRGIAKKLLKESIRYAQSKGAANLYLHSSDKMQKAIQLYEWLGFKRDISKDFHNHDILVKCFRFDIKTKVTIYEPI